MKGRARRAKRANGFIRRCVSCEEEQEMKRRRKFEVSSRIRRRSFGWVLGTYTIVHLVTSSIVNFFFFPPFGGACPPPPSSVRISCKTRRSSPSRSSSVRRRWLYSWVPRGGSKTVCQSTRRDKKPVRGATAWRTDLFIFPLPQRRASKVIDLVVLRPTSVHPDESPRSKVEDVDPQDNLDRYQTVARSDPRSTESA